MSTDLNANPTSYSDFVRSRFKADLPGNEAAYLHAIIGLAGEVPELEGATSRANLFEELGDMEFYLEAARLQLSGPRGSPMYYGPDYGISYRSVMIQLVDLGGSLIDSAKKAWVYGKPLNESNEMLLLVAVEEALMSLYELLGTSQAEIRRLNMEKLLKRYPAGYSDAAAIARADKVEGE